MKQNLMKKDEEYKNLKNKLSIGHSMTREEALMMSAFRSVKKIEQDTLTHYGIK